MAFRAYWEQEIRWVFSMKITCNDKRLAVPMDPEMKLWERIQQGHVGIVEYTEVKADVLFDRWFGMCW